MLLVWCMAQGKNHTLLTSLPPGASSTMLCAYQWQKPHCQGGGEWREVNEREETGRHIEFLTLVAKRKFNFVHF